MLGSRQSSHLKESVFFSHMYITHVEGFHSASFLPSFYFRTYLLQRQIYRRKEKQIWHLLVHSHQGLYSMLGFLNLISFPPFIHPLRYPFLHTLSFFSYSSLSSWPSFFCRNFPLFCVVTL